MAVDHDLGGVLELKEFLYVDVDRVRSLLAQMSGGFIEAIRSSTGWEASGGAQAMLFGIGGKGDYARSSQHEESRSMQDIIFTVFEERATEDGYITELPNDFVDPDKWSTGELHHLLAPGQLARIECDVQMLDGSFFQGRVDRFANFTQALVDMQKPPRVGKNASAAQKRTVAEASYAAVAGGMRKGELQAVSQAIQSMLGDSIALRLLPCGGNFLEFGFIGALLGRREYIQEERENLFSRYGQAPTRWTTVFQVAAIPDEPAGPPEFETSGYSLLDENGQVSRGQFEAMVTGMLGYLEALGLVEGPRWPSVSITPLGVYRVVPKAP